MSGCLFIYLFIGRESKWTYMTDGLQRNVRSVQCWESIRFTLFFPSEISNPLSCQCSIILLFGIARLRLSRERIKNGQNRSSPIGLLTFKKISLGDIWLLRSSRCLDNINVAKTIATQCFHWNPIRIITSKIMSYKFI